MKDKPAIVVKQLQKSYGDKRVLDGVDFSVERGSLFGFLGPNGAGKTTTMSIITGVLTPDNGTVEISGKPVNPNDENLRRRIGAVHDSLGLFEQLSGVEHAAFFASIYGVERKLIKKRSAELFEMLDLTEAASTRISDYSHGMKKKIALACALIHDPEILFLDEPFEGMDALSARVVMDNLRAIASRGKTIFLTSHILEIVEKLCDEVGILSDGRVVFQQNMADVLAGREQTDGDNEYSPLERIFVGVSSGKRQQSILSWV
jgi:ABC-2 type transport system ATP-binding protein